MNNKLRRLLPISAVPIALGASLVTSSFVRAADLGPVAPGGPTENTFAFGGTFNFKVVDANGSGVPDDGDITRLTFFNDEGEYSIDTAKGAFADFESVSITNLSQLGVPVIDLPFLIPFEPFPVAIPGLLELDSSAVTFPTQPPAEQDDNFYNLEQVFFADVVLEPTAVRLNLNTLGTYTGPDTGPLAGSWSINSTFDGYDSVAGFIDAVFVEGPDFEGGLDNSYASSGSIVDVPEPSTLGFLLLTTVGIMAGRKKREE